MDDEEIDDLFEGFADKAILMAERVECELETFKHGLGRMLAVIQQRIEQVDNEIAVAAAADGEDKPS